MPTTTREADYDIQLSPLVEQIRAICKHRGIPFVMSFDLSDEAHKGFLVTSASSRSRLPAALDEALTPIFRGTGYARPDRR